MENRIRNYFETETMPEPCARRIEESLTAKGKSAGRPRWVRAAAMTAALALVMLVGVHFNSLKVYAEELYDWIVHPMDETVTRPLGMGEDGIYYGYANDATYQLTPDKKGGHATSSDRDGADVVRIKDDRMYFIVNNEEIDITDLCSEETAFVYVLEDQTGILHYFIVGGTADDWGYEEILADPGDGSGLPRMIGGHGFNTQDMDEDLNFIDEAWVTDGYAKIGFPEHFG